MSALQLCAAALLPLPLAAAAPAEQLVWGNDPCDANVGEHCATRGVTPCIEALAGACAAARAHGHGEAGCGACVQANAAALMHAGCTKQDEQAYCAAPPATIPSPVSQLQPAAASCAHGATLSR